LTQHNKISATLTVFELRNDRGYFAPSANVQYDEKGNVISWFLTLGGTRCYVACVGRLSDAKIEETKADSHFMIHRVISSLVIARAGLFEPVVRGRVVFPAVDGQRWASEIDYDLPWSDEVGRVHASFEPQNFKGWITSIIENTFLRRALDDAVLALRYPVEAFVYIYRGFEWLESGLKISKKEMASAIKVELNNYRELGKIANVESGVRHASKTGLKSRAVPESYGTWICGLIDAINYARFKLDPSFVVMTPTEVAEVVHIAANMHPYP
jgi:hypothetical protein